MSQRIPNALEPGTPVPIHRYRKSSETVVCLRGRLREVYYNDAGTVVDSVVLCAEDGVYGVNIPKGVWHKLEAIEPNSVIFECKEGPFVPNEQDGILELPRK